MATPPASPPGRRSAAGGTVRSGRLGGGLRGRIGGYGLARRAARAGPAPVALPGWAAGPVGVGAPISPPVTGTGPGPCLAGLAEVLDLLSGEPGAGPRGLREGAAGAGRDVEGLVEVLRGRVRLR